MARKVTKVMFGDKKWEFGVNGCKLIEVQPLEKSTLIGVDFDGGDAITAHVKDETVFWWHKEQAIVIPDLDVSKIVEAS